MSDEPEHERRHLGDRIRERIREMFDDDDDEGASSPTSSDVLPTLREMFGEPDSELEPDHDDLSREAFDLEQHRRRETTHPPELEQ